MANFKKRKFAQKNARLTVCRAFWRYFVEFFPIKDAFPATILKTSEPMVGGFRRLRDYNTLVSFANIVRENWCALRTAAIRRGRLF